MSSQYVYLLQEREFIKTKESIYKIGKTRQENNARFKTYPKGSVLKLQSVCSNCDLCEKIIYGVFKKKYIQRKDIGNEYFEGDCISMIRDINSIVANNFDVDDDSSEEDDDLDEDQNDSSIEQEDSSEENDDSSEEQYKSDEDIMDNLDNNTIKHGPWVKIGDNCDVNKFLDSLIYFTPKKEHHQLISSEYYLQFMYKKQQLIKSAIKLFWDDGLLDMTQITVRGSKPLTIEQKLWFNKNQDDLVKCFKKIRKSRLPKTQYPMIKMIRKIVCDFFGGFLDINISNMERRRKGKDTICYYLIDIDKVRYVELLLIKNYKLLPKDTLKLFIEQHSEDECNYKTLHGYTTIGELYKHEKKRDKIKQNFMNLVDYINS